MLKDGRFVFVTENSSLGSIDSSVDIYVRCIFSESLQKLFLYGIDEHQRHSFHIDITPLDPTYVPPWWIIKEKKNSKQKKSYVAPSTKLGRHVRKPLPPNFFRPRKMSKEEKLAYKARKKMPLEIFLQWPDALMAEYGVGNQPQANTTATAEQSLAATLYNDLVTPSSGDAALREEFNAAWELS